MLGAVDWKTIALLCCTRYGVRAETQQCIRALVNRGVRDLVLDGLTDVALARNCALTAAAELTRQHRDIVMWLLVDDDMLWTVEAAERVISAALDSGRPTSGVYITNTGVPTVSPAKDGRPVRTGLGFFALPTQRLLQLYDESPERQGVGGNRFHVFVQCGLYPAGALPWCSEDHWLCERLGNVDVEPVAVTHLRVAQLQPDAATVAHVATAVRGTKENTS